VVELEKSGMVGVDFSCSAPELNINPIVLDVSLNGNSVDRITFWNHKTVSRRYFIPPDRQQQLNNRLEFNLSRTWNPRREEISADSRNLGVAISEPKFLAPILTGDIGFYDWQLAEEKDTRLLKYRWVNEEIVIDLENYRATPLTLLMKSDQPYIEEQPVEINFFQRHDQVGSIRLADYNWTRFSLSKQLKRDLPLTIRVSRTFNPKREGYSQDPRDLGVAIAIEHKEQ